MSGRSRRNWKGEKVMIKKIEYEQSEYIIDVLNVDDLRVDATYQRGEQASVKKMVREFNPNLLEVIQVNLRDDNRYFVIDGQQRTAACKVVGYKKIDAKVFIGLSVKQEAKMYDDINRNRKDVTALDRFKARLAYDEEIAVELNKIILENGFRVSKASKGEKGKRVINAINEYEAIYANSGNDRWYIDTILKIAEKAWGGSSESTSFAMARGLGAFLKRYKDEFKMDRLVRSMEKTTPNRLRAEGQKYSELFSGSSGMAVGIGIWKEYNSGLRSNRLSEWK